MDKGFTRISLKEWKPKRSSLLTSASAGFMSVFFRYFFDSYSVKGINNIPKKGRVLIAGEHKSFLDPPLVEVIILQKGEKYYTLAANEKLFYNKWLRLYMERMGTQIVPQAMPRSQLEEFTEKYSEIIADNNLIWFPQGGRGRDGRPHKYHPGMILPAMLAGLKDSSLDIAVINARIDYRVALEDFLKQNKGITVLLNLHNASSVTVSFSEPLYLNSTIDEYCRIAGTERGKASTIDLRKANPLAKEFIRKVEAQY
jgi:1-acyl-sn-glycerol-3-phosphate acyltransferase